MLDIKNIPVEDINQNRKQNANFVRMKNLMDVKMAIFKFYNIPVSPTITIKKAAKTLAQQTPNNAYGIPITDEEIKLFMNRFGLNEDDEFTAISKRIIQSVLNS